MKCHVQNIHTMDELKMTGNCLKGSRGLVAFDGNWQGEEWKSLTKELLTHVSFDGGRMLIMYGGLTNRHSRYLKPPDD